MTLKKTVITQSTPLNLTPNKDSLLETECLFGEQVDILDEKKEWFKCNTLLDNYNGWIKKTDLSLCPSPTHRVISSRSFVYLNNNIKSNILHYLPMGSKLKILNFNENGQKFNYIKIHWEKQGLYLQVI